MRTFNRPPTRKINCLTQRQNLEDKCPSHAHSGRLTESLLILSRLASHVRVHDPETCSTGTPRVAFQCFTIGHKNFVGWLYQHVLSRRKLQNVNWKAGQQHQPLDGFITSHFTCNNTCRLHCQNSCREIRHVMCFETNLSTRRVAPTRKLGGNSKKNQDCKVYLFKLGLLAFLRIRVKDKLHRVISDAVSCTKNAHRSPLTKWKQTLTLGHSSNDLLTVTLTTRTKIFVQARLSRPFLACTEIQQQFGIIIAIASHEQQNVAPHKVSVFFGPGWWVEGLEVTKGFGSACAPDSNRCFAGPTRRTGAQISHKINILTTGLVIVKSDVSEHHILLAS